MEPGVISYSQDTLRIPASVLSRSVPVFDADGIQVMVTETEATYCWEFTDQAGAQKYINADVDVFMELPEPIGHIVGTLAKVDPSTGAYKWAGPNHLEVVHENWMVAMLPYMANQKRVESDG